MAAVVCSYPLNHVTIVIWFSECIHMSKVIEKILEILQIQAEETVDLLDTIFSDRSTSYRKARRSIRRGAPEFKTAWADWYRERQAFYSLLNKLKREGLIKREREGKTSFWNITKLGKQKLFKLRKYPKKTLNPSRKNYPKKATHSISIISYDIPEKERRKRDWLRATLFSLGLTKLQNSVWAGAVEVPEALVKDLRAHNMIRFVHIFSVSKEGTITHAR